MAHSVDCQHARLGIHSHLRIHFTYVFRDVGRVKISDVKVTKLCPTLSSACGTFVVVNSSIGTVECASCRKSHHRESDEFFFSRYDVGFITDTCCRWRV